MCCVYLLMPVNVWAGNVLVLDDQVEIDLRRYVEVLSAPDARLTVTDLNHADFKPVTDGKLVLPNTPGVHWLRLRLRLSDLHQVRQRWVLHVNQQPSLESVTFFESQPSGGFRQVLTGQNYSYASRDVDNLTFAFNVSMLPQQEKLLYLRVDKVSVGRGIPLTLKSEARFISFDRFSWMVIAGYYSALAAIFLFNLLLQIRLRARSHFFYLMYLSIFAISMSSIDGTASLLIEQGLPNFLRVPDEAYVLLMLVTQVLFVYSLLDMRTHFPGVNRLTLPVVGFISFCAVVTVFVGRNELTVKLLAASMALSWAFLLMLTGLAMVKRIAGATYLFLAELSMICGYVVATQAYYGGIPANDFTSYMPAKVGNVCQLIFFSMVLGDKVSHALKKSFDAERRLISAQAAAETAERLSREDPLTGIHNRRALLHLGAQALKEAHRYQRRCCALMLDIDHFKRVNDGYGHATGDVAIRAVTQLCQTMARAPDNVGRIGGEEFVLILPDTQEEGAYALAERIRQRIAAETITSPEGVPFQVTVSIGVVEAGRGVNIDRLLDQADKAMYVAKNAGRNQTVVFRPEMAETQSA